MIGVSNTFSGQCDYAPTSSCLSLLENYVSNLANPIIYWDFHKID